MSKPRRSHLSHTDREFIVAQIKQLRIWLTRIGAAYPFQDARAEKAREAREVLAELQTELGEPPEVPPGHKTSG